MNSRLYVLFSSVNAATIVEWQLLYFWEAVSTFTTTQLPKDIATHEKNKKKG